MLGSGGLGLVSGVVRGLWGPLISTEKTSKTISITVIMTLYYCGSALYQNLSKGCWWLCALSRLTEEVVAEGQRADCLMLSDRINNLVAERASQHVVV